MNYCRKLCSTLSLCGTICSLGIALVVHGATLLQLQTALHVDMAMISLIFPAFGVGNVLGTFPAASSLLGHGRRRYIVSFIVGIVAGGMMALIPFSTYLELVITAFAVFGFCYGYLDTDLTTIVTDIWGDKSDTYLVALRGSSSIGIFIGGFICLPFVEAIAPHPGQTLATNLTINDTGDRLQPMTTAMIMTSNSVSADGSLSKLDSIYLISMAIIVSMSCVMFVTMMTTLRSVVVDTAHDEEEQQRLITGVDGSFSRNDVSEAIKNRDRQGFLSCSDLLTIFLLCVVVGTTMGSTGSFCNYIASFSSAYLKLTPQDGALLVSIYGGSTFLSNIAVSFLVKVFRSSSLIFITLSLSIIAFTVISIVPDGQVVIWISTVLFGLGNIPTMCVTYVHAEQLNFLTRRVAGAFAASYGLMGFLATLVTGILFDINPMSMMYFCLTSSVLGLIAFICAVIIVKRRSQYQRVY